MAGGGATMNYPTGSLTTDLIALQALMATGGAYMNAKNQSLKASSMYLTFMGGAAYSVSKNISFSLAIRNVGAANKAEGGMTLSASPLDLPDQPLVINYKENANGIGAVFGVNMSYGEKFNFAARYESQIKLDFKTKTTADDFGITTDGQLNRRDLPSVAAFGAAFKPSAKVQTYLDFNYYFQEQADWGKSTIATDEKPLSSLAGDVYSIGAGMEYFISPKTTMSIGGGYTKYMYNDKAGYYTHLGTFEVMQDDNSNINTGIAYMISKKVRVNGSYMHTFWAKDQTIKALIAQPLDVNVKVNNSMNAVAFGVELSF
jgi:long-chain fatty acid transport protein